MTKETNDIASLRFPPKMERAARLAARGWRKADIGRDQQVAASRSTLDRWFENPEFQARVEALRTSVDLQATEVLQDALTDAARVMRDIIRGVDMSVPVTCPGCGADVTVDVKADLRVRQKTAQWLLDTYYRGKLPQHRPTPTGEREEAGDGLDPETKRLLLKRGHNAKRAEDVLAGGEPDDGGGGGEGLEDDEDGDEGGGE